VNRGKRSRVAGVQKLQKIECLTSPNFTELRSGYICSWCQLEKGQLMVIPHPQSRQAVQHFDYPSQAEVVGRVTGVAMRIVDNERSEPGKIG
jgi:hypothetical protein